MTASTTRELKRKPRELSLWSDDQFVSHDFGEQVFLCHPNDEEEYS